ELLAFAEKLADPAFPKELCQEALTAVCRQHALTERKLADELERHFDHVRRELEHLNQEILLLRTNAEQRSRERDEGRGRFLGEIARLREERISRDQTLAELERTLDSMRETLTWKLRSTLVDLPVLPDAIRWVSKLTGFKSAR